MKEDEENKGGTKGTQPQPLGKKKPKSIKTRKRHAPYAPGLERAGDFSSGGKKKQKGDAPGGRVNLPPVKLSGLSSS